MDADLDINVLPEIEQAAYDDIDLTRYLEENNYGLILENYTIEKLECANKYNNESLLFAKLYPEGFCDTIFDSISCWPPTPLNNTAVISCFSEFGGVFYDPTCKYCICLHLLI